MTDGLLSLIGCVAITASSTLLYLASSHQRLLKTAPAPRIVLTGGGAAMVAGIAAWIAAWGGFVGGLLALAVWMTASTALPYLLALRR